MAEMHTISRSGAIIAGAIAFLLVSGVAVGRADLIALRGGGQIRGKVVTDPEHADRLLILTEKGKAPLSFEKPAVRHVTPEPSVLDEYVTRRTAVSLTADAQYGLGLWCEEKKLAGLAELHYEAAARQDKSFAPAHQKLGHVLFEERWLTPDELRTAKGLVRYKGKWVTKEEKERYDELAAASAEQLALAKKIQRLRQTMANGSDERRSAAEAELLALTEPIAVRPLVRVLGEDEEATFRLLLDRILGAMAGPEAASALTSRVLMEPEIEVRMVTLMQLDAHEEPNVVFLLTKALRSSNPVVVNRAAWALGHRNVAAAVPRLIAALFTTQYQVVLVGGSGSSGSFGSVTPTAGLVPAVGVPDVTAVGATGPSYTSAAPLTLGGVSSSRGPVPRLVPVTYQNAEVHAALVKLTGQDFGWDTETWNHWARTSFRSEPAPARKVPQP